MANRDKPSAASADKPDNPNQSKGRKKRRWPRRLIVIALLLAAMVFAAPYLAATGPVRGWILSSVSNSIRGRVEVEGLSLGWFSPPSATGVVVFDPEGRAVLTAPDIRARKSLLSLATAPTNFGRIDIRDANVVLIRKPDGGYTISDALASVEPEPAEAEAAEPPLPEIRGTVAIHGARLTMIDPEGRRLELTDADSTVSIDTLNKLSGTQSVRLPGGAVVRTRYDLTGLVRDGKFHLGGLAGTLTVRTNAPAQIEPIGRFALPGKALTGTASLDANFRFVNGMPDGRFALVVSHLKADAGRGRLARPVSFALIATAKAEDANVWGNLHLDGALGRLVGTYRYEHQPLPDLTAERVLSAVLTGEKLGLPPMALDGNANIDLAALAGAAPSLLGVRRDVRITRGAITLTTLSIRGGSAPSLHLAGAVEDVTAVQTDPATQQDRPIALAPIQIALDSDIVAGTGLRVERLGLDSVFARASGSGTPKDFRARCRADLAAARAEIGKVIDLGQLTLTGTLGGSLTASMDERRQLTYQFDANAVDIAVGPAGPDPLTMSEAALSAQGRLTHDNGRNIRVTEVFRLFADDGLALVANGSWAAGTGALDANATIERAEMGWAWAKAKAMGAAGPKVMGGGVSGWLSASRPDANTPLQIAGELTGADLSADGNALLAPGEQLVVKLPKLTADLAAGAYAADQVSVAFGKALAAGGAARFATRTGALDANAGIDRGDLAALADVAKAFGVRLARPVAGTIKGTVRASRKSADEPIAAEATLIGKQVQVDGNSISKRDIELVATGLRAAGSDAGLSAESITLTSDAATVTAKQLNVRTGGQDLALAGDIEVSADLAQVAKIASAFGDANAEPMEISGTLTYAGKAAKAGDKIALTGAGEIERFRAGAEPNAVAVEPLTFEQVVRIDPNDGILVIESATVKSDALNLTASGSIRDFTKKKILDIRGHYKGRWDKILAVARPFAPAAGEVAITGPLESDFTLTGPAAQPKLTPVYRGMNAQANVGWQTAHMLGFGLGEANVPVTLEEGKLVVPATKIPAIGDGTVNLAAIVALDPNNPPQLAMPGRQTVLDGVRINEEVGQKVLSRINPIFSKLLSLEGKINLTTRDIDVPLGEAIKKRGTGAGHIDLSEIQIEPAGIMGTLLEFGGLGGKQLVRVGGVDFAIRDGAVTYENFGLTFGKDFDLIFRGAVRFDESVDMAVSVPVRPELLKKLGVKGDVGKYAEYLSGARVEIPMLGTRGSPRLDLTKVDIKPLLKKAAEKMLKDQAGGVLGDLLGGGLSDLPGLPGLPGQDPKTRPAPDSPGPTTQKAPKRDLGSQLLDSIFDALNKDKKE